MNISGYVKPAGEPSQAFSFDVKEVGGTDARDLYFAGYELRKEHEQEGRGSRGALVLALRFSDLTIDLLHLSHAEELKDSWYEIPLTQLGIAAMSVEEFQVSVAKTEEEWEEFRDKVNFIGDARLPTRKDIAG